MMKMTGKLVQNNQLPIIFWFHNLLVRARTPFFMHPECVIEAHAVPKIFLIKNKYTCPMFFVCVCRCVCNACLLMLRLITELKHNKHHICSIAYRLSDMQIISFFVRMKNRNNLITFPISFHLDGIFYTEPDNPFNEQLIDCKNKST